MKDFRIFFDARAIREGMTGVGIYSFNILTEISKIFPPENISALVLKEHVYHKLELSSKVDIIETQVDYESHPKNEIWENTSLVSLAKKKNTDIFFGPAFVIPIVRTPFKKIVTIHDYIAIKYPQTYSFLFRNYIKLISRASAMAADKIIAVSQRTKKDISELTGTDKRKIEVVYNGVSDALEKLKSQDDEAPAIMKIPKPFLLFLSALERRKDPLTLLKAYIIAREKYGVKNHLVFVGGIPRNSHDIKREIEASQYYPEYIHLINYVDNDRIASFYKSAACFVFPSRYEGFGIPPLEAMRLGCPVISSDIEIEREILSDAAEYFPAGDYETLAKQIRNVINDPRLKESLIQKGYSQSLKYSWKNAAQNLLEIFEKSLN